MIGAVSLLRGEPAQSLSERLWVERPHAAAGHSKNVAPTKGARSAGLISKPRLNAVPRLCASGRTLH